MPLFVAAAMHDVKAIEWLAAGKVDMNKKAGHGESVFFSVFDTCGDTKDTYAFGALWKETLERVGFNKLSYRVKQTDATTIRALLDCKVRPKRPSERWPNAPHIFLSSEERRHWPDAPVIVANRSDLEVSLISDCSQDAAILLFEDGTKRVEGPKDWYLLAFWTSVRYDHDFRRWLLEKWDDFIDKDIILYSEGGPASRYTTAESWLRAGVNFEGSSSHSLPCILKGTLGTLSRNGSLTKRSYC